jgi:hypothetical protein
MLPEDTQTLEIGHPGMLIKTFKCTVNLLPLVFQLVDFAESCAAIRLPIREFLSPDCSGKSGLIRDRKTEKL